MHSDGSPRHGVAQSRLNTTTPPRPSPTKRAFSSQELRRSKSRLMPSTFATERNVLGQEDVVDTPATPPEPVADGEGTKCTTDTDGQTRRLLEMDESMAIAFTKLASQYYASEYNSMKRFYASSGSAIPPSFDNLPALPTSRPSLPPSSVSCPAVPRLPANTSPHSRPAARKASPARQALVPLNNSSETSLTPTMARFTVVESLASAPTTLELPKIAMNLKHLKAKSPAMKTSSSHPLNISSMVPVDQLALLSAAHYFPSDPSASHATPGSLCASPFRVSSRHAFDLFPLTASTEIAQRAVMNVHHSLSSLPDPVKGRTDIIGNMLLSSCPGKKVRLDGQISVGVGNLVRGAICRDLRMDLETAMKSGVKALVCCLDDDELALLGAPWSEYSSTAAALGLPIIRIPMAEGFAPLSPESFDASLSEIIRMHTLKGETVLCHCRGGVGRAGLLATCWMVKMGLVGDRTRGGKTEVIQTVEKVIHVVRRRRSTKAIETPQQVHFLFQYVHWLYDNATVIDADHFLAQSQDLTSPA